ncbi:MAG: LuxR C-terminal-related transcriptional regulator [Anaerolineae bacterium]|jgi:ATP/maltotriose-dependent transcriptional regulator MalT|nr:LuxR C-terminal-related transcriptional regulator [Anaerolineae bacterium]
MLTVRGQYRYGVVDLLEEVPLEGEHQVLVTFLDAPNLVVVPQNVHTVAARAASLAACAISQREYEVLRMLYSGATNREIATELGIRPGTVRNHTSSIYEKLGVRNRLEAVARATELGVLGKES